MPVHSAVPTASQQPRLADRPGVEQRPAVAGAFERDRHGDGRSCAQVVDAELRAAVEALERQMCDAGVDERHVVVDQQVVHAGRRHVGSAAPRAACRGSGPPGASSSSPMPSLARRRMHRCKHVRARAQTAWLGRDGRHGRREARVRSVGRMSIRERLETLSRGELDRPHRGVVVTMAGAGLWYVRSLPKPVTIAAGAPAPGRPSGAAAPRARSPRRRARRSSSTSPAGCTSQGSTSSPRAIG